MRYGRRLWKLRVLQAEMKMTIRSATHPLLPSELNVLQHHYGRGKLCPLTYSSLPTPDQTSAPLRKGNILPSFRLIGSLLEGNTFHDSEKENCPPGPGVGGKERKELFSVFPLDPRPPGSPRPSCPSSHDLLPGSPTGALREGPTVNKRALKGRPRLWVTFMGAPIERVHLRYMTIQFYFWGARTFLG